MLCRREAPPRVREIQLWQRVQPSLHVMPIDWDVVYDDTTRPHPVILFKRIDLHTLFDGVHCRLGPLRADQILGRFLEPMASFMRRLDELKLTHRGITCQNFYFDSLDKHSPFIIGSALCDPPGFLQDSIFETVTTAQAPPYGRGRQGIHDDLYALGVMTLALLRGEVPCHDESAEEVLCSKLVRGSYKTLIGDLPVPRPFSELLNGLLADDLAQRWKVEDFVNWTRTRQARPKNLAGSQKTKVSYSFRGKNYNSPDLLAYELSKDWTAAMSEVGKASLVQWFVSNAVNDDRRARRFAQLQQEISTDTLEREISCSHMLALLAPRAPIRFRQICLMPSAIGNAMIANIDNREKLNDIRTMIQKSTHENWQAALDAHDHASTIDAMSSVNSVLRLRNEGFVFAWGEHMLYRLSPDYACRSPLLEGYYVVSLVDLLPALENYVSTRELDSLVIDRHIVGFLLAHNFQFSAKDLSDIAPPASPAAQARATLQIFMRLQESTGGHAYPNLARVLVKMLGPALRQIRNTRLAREISEKIQQISADGMFRSFFRLVYNEKILQEDRQRYDNAIEEYADLEEKSQELLQIQRDMPQEARKVSEDLSVIFSSLFAVASLLFLLLWLTL